MAALAAGRPAFWSPAGNAEQTARDIVAHRITHINATDSAAAQLLDIDGPSFSNARLPGYAAFNAALPGIVQHGASLERDQDPEGQAA